MSKMNWDRIRNENRWGRGYTTGGIRAEKRVKYYAQTITREAISNRIQQTGKEMPLKYSSACKQCGKQLAAGTRANWKPGRGILCLDCYQTKKIVVNPA